MKIYPTANKRAFMPLLLLADEQPEMIEKYLDAGTMYVLDDGGIKAEIVTVGNGDTLEIKNLAVLPQFRNRGYGRALIRFTEAEYRGKYTVLTVGTGDSPLTVPFYEKCGFVRSHSVKNFFIDNYDHEIYEGGVKLVDMVYLSKKI